MDVRSDSVTVPKPPYYAVLFTAKRSRRDGDGYDAMDTALFAKVGRQQGYLGHECFSRADGTSLTISYWQSLEDITAWRDNALHQEARRRGREA